MNYYYDIKLNFAEENLLFFEWESMDDFEIFKKVPLFQVKSKTIKDFLNNNVKVSQEFLNIIKDKAQKKNEVLPYIALFADKNGAIALEFNEDGLSTSRSFLQLEDELNLIEYLYTLKIEKIEYEIIKKIPHNTNLRVEDKIKLLINTEVKSLIKNNNIAKLSYLYMEWFNKVPKNIEEIKTTIDKVLQEKITSNELKIYNLIKLSYSNV